MNKEEYMSKLKEALAEFDEEVRDEILNDYEDHFAAGVANGKTEEQVLSELGSIEELVSELKELKGENTTNANSDKKTKFNFDIDIDTDDISKSVSEVTKGIASFFGTLAATITKGAENVGGNVANGAEDIAGGIVKGFEVVSDKVVKTTTEFADEVVKSYKDKRGSEDNKAETNKNEEAVSEESASADADCDSLVVETDCGDISVKGTEGSQINVEYTNHGTANQKLAYSFEGYTKGTTYYVVVKRKPGSTNFFRSLSSPDIDIDITIPRGIKSVELSTGSGEIEVENVDIKKFKLRDVSGDVSLNDGVFETLEINAVSGDSSLKNVNTVKLAATSISGDVNMQGALEEGKVTSTSGDVFVNAGNVNKLVCSTVSGDIDVNMIECTGYKANVSSVSGDCTLGWHEGASVKARNGSHTVGDASVDVTVHSVSGDISVNA